MAYPHRPPPQRHYTPRPGPPPDQWQGYDQGGYYDYRDQGYNDYGGYGDYGDYGYYDQGGYGYDPGYAPRSRRDQYPPRMPPPGRSKGGPPPDRRMDPRARDPRDPRGPRDPRDPRDPRMRHEKSFNRPPPLQQPPKPRPGDRRMMPPNSPGGPKFSDSPFPTMPTKQGSATDQTMDEQMEALNINDNSGRAKPADARPHTSNSNRPHPGRNQTEPAPYGQPDAAWENGSAARGMPPPKRSATMPVNPGQQAAYPGQSTWQEPPPGGHRQYGAGPQRPGTAPGIKPGPSDSPVAPPMPPSQTPISTPPKTGDHADAATDFLDDYYDSAGPPEPDMPNFNAMPGGPHGDDNLIPGTNSKSEQSKPEGGGGYTAYRPPGGVVQPMTPTGSNMNQFDNAGFQFDLPDSSSNPYDHGQPADDYGYGQPPQSRGGMYGDPAYNGGQGGFGQQQPPNQYSSPMHGGSAGQPGPQNIRQMQSGTPAPNGQSSEPTNPDALPHHPVPFRPGLDQGSKPAPVRQYDNPPPQTSNAPVTQHEPGAAPVITHTDLLRLQQVAKNNPSDQKTQLLLAEKLVEASIHLIDDNGKADTRTKNKNRERFILDAHKIVKKLVSAGYPPAMFYLADCYGQGSLGLQVDQREAFNLYQSAAKGGHPESAYRLAVCCEMGHEGGGGTKRDPIKAVQWYRRAAALGDTPAMYKMGIILLKGLLGQQRNPREAVSWLKRAAERANEENPHALHELALLYENPGNNDTIIRDEQYAMELLVQAAELGYKFSQHRLGAAFEYGLMGCPVDARQSIIWYTRAAAQGEHQSELSLSGWYLTGADGILQQSDTEAYLWARKAAIAGLAKAEYAMGYFSEVGIGVPANLEDAKRWYWKASSQNFLKARERLEDLRRGGAKMQKTRVSRSAVNRQNEGDCVVM